MSPLDEIALNKAAIAYASSDGGWEERLEAAIEAYPAEVFKPGSLVVGEAIEPQRDYRKELWIDAWNKTGSSTTANAALQQFDMTFGGAK